MKQQVLQNTMYFFLRTLLEAFARMYFMLRLTRGALRISFRNKAFQLVNKLGSGVRKSHKSRKDFHDVGTCHFMRDLLTFSVVFLQKYSSPTTGCGKRILRIAKEVTVPSLIFFFDE